MTDAFPIDLEITGQLDEPLLNALEQDLDEMTVLLESGFDGQKLLAILGAATAAQLSRIRHSLLRLFGSRTVGSITIKRGDNHVVIESVHAKDVPDVVAAAAEILDRMAKDRGA